MASLVFSFPIRIAARGPGARAALVALALAVLCSAGASAQMNSDSSPLMTKSGAKNPQRGAVVAAAKKSLDDQKFKDALNNTRVADVAKIMIANGARSNISVFVRRPASFKRYPGKQVQYDLNGGNVNWICGKWQLTEEDNWPGYPGWTYQWICLWVSVLEVPDFLIGPNSGL